MTPSLTNAGLSEEFQKIVQLDGANFERTQDSLSIGRKIPFVECECLTLELVKAIIG